MNAPPDRMPAPPLVSDRNAERAVDARQRPRRLPELHYAASVALVFGVVSGVLAARHAMWRDELQAWMIARDSTSLVGLFRNLRYEGHPALWHLCLFLLSRVTRAPEAMQAFHVAIATTSAFLFVRYAPFSRLLRLLFTFGYFPAYQYAVIARSYVLGWLLIVGFCIVSARAGRRAAPLAALLFLLANTSAYGWILAFSLGLGLVPEAISLVRRDRDCRPLLLACALIVAVGLAVSLVQMVPPADSTYRSAAVAPVGQRLGVPTRLVWETIDAVGAAYLPLAEAFGVAAAGSTWAFVLLTIFGLALLRRPAAAIVYASSLVAMVLLKVFVYPGGIWHDGHFLLALLACLWLYQNHAGEEGSPGPVVRVCGRAIWPVLCVMLITHLVFTGRTVLRDWHTPYSAGKVTAQFIREQGLDRLPMLGDADYAASTVSGYLDRTMYYPRMGRWGTFVIWDGGRAEVSEAKMRAQGEALARTYRQDALLVLNHELPTGAPDWLNSTLLYTSPRAVWEDERYWVYRLVCTPAVAAG